MSPPPPKGVRCTLSSTGVSTILLLVSNIKAICGMSDFKTQEIAKMSKIFHLKLLTKKIIGFLNATEVITNYNHIIHI